MTQTPPPTPPPGWYPDPSGASARRYWDGKAWGPLEPSPQQLSSAVPPRWENSTPPPTPTTAAVQKWWAGMPRTTKLALGGAGTAALVVGGVGIYNQENKSCPLPSAVGEAKDLQANAKYQMGLSNIMDKANEPGRVGEEVRDGDFAFVVHSIDACPGDSVKVAMTVTNIKDKPRVFRADNQKLLRDALRPTGAEPQGGYGCSPCDGIGDVLNLNPDDAVNTIVKFDIKGEDPQIVAVVVHDSWLSNGVMVFP